MVFGHHEQDKKVGTQPVDIKTQMDIERRKREILEINRDKNLL